MDKFENKTVVITGASQGIGEAAARMFAELDANVILLARSKDKIEKISAEINAGFKKSIAIQCDVSNAEQVKTAIDLTIKKFKYIDILIGNAGAIEPIKSILDMAISDFDKIIDINVKGVWYGIKSVLPYMKNGGTIITVGSGAATSPLDGWSH